MTRMSSSSDAAGPSGSATSPNQRLLGVSKDTVDDIQEYVLGGSPDRAPAGRFVKGRSGNPKGRPKQEPSYVVTPLAQLDPESLSGLVLRHGNRTVKAQTEDGEVEVSLKEANLRTMIRQAVKGNTGHSRTFIQLLGRAEAEEAKRKLETFRYWSRIKEQAEQLYAERERAGDKAPLFVHPDDIELSADGTVEIVGPTQVGDIAVTRYYHSRVDYHIVNMAYHQWVERRAIRKRGRRIDGILYAELDFWCEQHKLPPRMRMSIDEIADRLRVYRRMSGRALHTLLRQKANQYCCYAPPRDLQHPIIIPTTALEIARQYGCDGDTLLSLWPDAVVAAHKKLSESGARSASMAA